MDLSKIKMPSWLPTTLHDLMNVAEELFGPGTGAAKKRWVKAAVLDALKAVDVPNVPAWIEEPAKAALVDFLIEVIWSLHFREPDALRFLRSPRRAA